VSWRSPPIEAGPETTNRLVPIPLAAGALSHGQTMRQTLIDSSIAPRMNTRLIPCFGCATAAWFCAENQLTASARAWRSGNDGGWANVRPRLALYPRLASCGDFLRAAVKISETPPCGRKTNAGKGIANYS
jgi:hypothetical protein